MENFIVRLLLVGVTIHCSYGRTIESSGHRMDWEDYHELEDINDYLSYLANNYPDIVQLQSIGNSFEGRPLNLLHISSNFSAHNPAIWIEGGIHAREWIAPAVATFIISQLVEEPSNKNLLNGVDYWVMPVANPDGYKYSSFDRLWRKNRSINPESPCIGTDLNRNFDIHFMETGSSSDPCKGTYAGPEALSEPESQAIAKALLNNVQNVKMYITLHSFGQYWLVPYGYGEVYPEDYDELLNLAEKAANQTTRYKYTVGNTAKTLYPSAGGSDDWAKSIGVKYAYTIELPPMHGDQSQRYELDRSEILPVAEDLFPAIKVLIKEVANRFSA